MRIFEAGSVWKWKVSEVMETMEKSARIYVAGHRGMVGSALVRCFEAAGYHNLIWVRLF